ncbi:unnamed protein product [Penicillium egyptiacum]|uniref:NACHT domain-containing protein n=1 Tax=Penicillium egyptiacum TaxID=1303716 RepID=A0A9W4K3A8_9EURO|nr:unnamed protein product [Penicillium egyptiacum]
MGKETAVAANPTQKQDTDTREAESTPASLWDKAYDSLKQEQSNLLSRYEDLLSRVLIKAEANDLSAPNQGEDSGDVSNRIPQHNTTARQEILKQITELGLKHMEDKKVKVTILGHEIGLQDSIGKVGETVDWARKYIQDAIKDVPYASAVMAGISLILPLLKNPAAIDTASREGFTYVTSQTRYYIEMESLLLPEDMKPDLKSDLTERVLDLYKLVIEFQVQSVMRFYRSRTKNYFRSIINYDSWKDKLEHLQKEESSLEEKFEKALSSTSLQQLKKLAREAEGSRKTLDNILNNIQELVFISQDQKAILERTERHLSNAEDRRCRETLQATDPSLDKERIEEDKGGLLKDSYSWVLSNDDFQNWRDASYSQLLWIKGDPGKGKTMLLCGIIDELSKMATDKTNISFFFCQATNSRINNATAVLRGLIYMLVRQQPSLITHVRDGCFEGENAWFALLRVFNSILEDPHLHRTYLIIDALDECTADLSRLLHLLVQKSPACSHVRWIVSSRNWPGIEKDLNDTTQIKLRLELNEDILTAAVDSFIQYKTNKLAEENNYSPRLRDDVQHHLVSKANGTFLWAALVCKNLARVPARNVRKKLENFPSGLDELYQRMLNQISESDDAEFCKHLLDITTTVYRPVTLDELASFIDLPEDVAGDYETLKEIIESCGSFLTLRERKISLVHQSAKDFLLQKASAKIFLGHAENIHHFIFSRSLQVISGILRRDIFNIRSPGFPIDQVKTPYPDPLAAAQYSCVYWVDHLLDYHAGQTEGWSKDLQDGGMVDEFLRTKYLYWFEALALLRCLSEGALAISRLTDLAQRVAKGSQLLSHIQYARRFILYFKGAIEQSPLQVYTSAPVFSPACSLIRGLFKKEEPQWIMNKPAMEDSWSACLQTLEGHSHGVSSVVFSHDSRLLASTSDDKTLKLWDATNGQCLQTLEGHSYRVKSVVFSHDSRLLASALLDKTVKLWDATNGQCLQTLEGHSHSVW